METETALVNLRRAGGVLWLELNRPERHNSLDAALIEALSEALSEMLYEANDGEIYALVLAARGCSFSTGGDLVGFLDHAQHPARLAAYARRLVGGLHNIVLDLLACPVPVIARVHGPVTGGALGLVLAADMVAMAEDAFLQPYYTEVGFAPDGGWTALLPDRLGPALAGEIQYLNRRIDAGQARALGLASHVGPGAALDAVIEGWLAELAQKDGASLRASRQLIWDEARRTEVAARLQAETEAFVELVTRPETRRRMARFMAGLGNNEG
jgi:2-(1,2-epoxy-1,2-dihydrophenyl)acetyl-CoA isomerase